MVELDVLKAQLLAEPNDYTDAPKDIGGVVMAISMGWTLQYEMDPDFDYEPAELSRRRR